MANQHRPIPRLRAGSAPQDQSQQPGEAKGQAAHDTPTDSHFTARVLVCICEHPAMPQIIRSAARIATERRAELYALHVEPPGNSTRCHPAVAAQFANNLRLARDLGAQVELVRSHRVAQSILQFARDHQIDTIVLGRSSHSRRRILGRDLADRVRRGCGAIEVCVIVEDS